MIRTFLALPLHELFAPELRDYLPRLQQSISGVRWVPENLIHITLHFFGEIPKEEVPKIRGLIQPVAASFAPLRIGLKNTGFFPDRLRPRILWMDVTGEVDRLKHLQQAIEEKLGAAGYPLEKRAFTPHATVGRAKAAPLQLPPQIPETQTVEKVLDHLVLYKSTPTAQGSFYEISETFPFSQKQTA
jgi:2'-5' RNA ligase